MFRAERGDGKGYVQGFYQRLDGDCYILAVESKVIEPENGFSENFLVPYPIKPETLEILIQGEWRLVSDIEKPKRKPDKDGMLPLTDEEKKEFSLKFLKHTNFIYRFLVIGDRVHMQFLNGVYDNFCDNYKAIEWLLKRFNLEDTEL